MDVDEHRGARDCVPQQFSHVSDHHSTQRPSRDDPTLPNLVSIVHCRCVLDLRPFQNVRLRGGFTLAEVVLTVRALLDPLERAATAQTIIRGSRFYVFLRADLDEREISISLNMKCWRQRRWRRRILRMRSWSSTKRISSKPRKQLTPGMDSPLLKPSTNF